jgi:hypothetical protein
LGETSLEDLVMATALVTTVSIDELVKVLLGATL